MLSEFENKVADFIEAHSLFESADKVLLAVSGGADSTALLHTMCALKAEGVVSAELFCAHINHQLRGAQADADEDFVIAQARSLNLPVTTRQVDVRGFAQKNKLSIETAGRNLRIENLINIAKAKNCRCIATAHQKNDNAETIVQRLLRGTGFRGLGGIWPRRKFGSEIEFVRPMLSVRRDEIVEYLEKKNLKWRTDHTNYDYSYRRNFIRHKLLPAIQKESGNSVVEQLFKLSQSAQRFYSFVCNRAENIWPGLAKCSRDKIALDSKAFPSQPMPIRVELVRRSLATLGSGEGDLTQRHYKTILRLAEQNASGKKIELPNGFVVRREYGKLIFARKGIMTPREQQEEVKEIKVPGQSRFGDYFVEATIFEADKCDIEKFKKEKNEFVEWFDLDKVQFPLVVRFRSRGDKFWPLGLTGKKKVGKFLTTAKVPQQIRRELLIVADTEKIIWLWPVRISEQAKVSGETRKILQLQIDYSV